MNKFLSILAAIEGIEESLLASKVPVVSTGLGGNILTVALIAEAEVSSFLAALKAAKTPEAPAAPVATPTPAS